MNGEYHGGLANYAAAIFAGRQLLHYGADRAKDVAYPDPYLGYWRVGPKSDLCVLPFVCEFWLLRVLFGLLGFPLPQFIGCD